MKIKELANVSEFSTKDLNKVLSDCDAQLTKMTAVDNIDEILLMQETAVAELQKRSAAKND